jgi:hypothetical protein
MVSCARATRGLRRMGMVAWPSSCSRNAHDKNVLVRRAQSRIDQATLENKMGNWEKRAVGEQSAHLVYGNMSKFGGSIGRQSAPRCAPAILVSGEEGE